MGGSDSTLSYLLDIVGGGVVLGWWVRRWRWREDTMMKKKKKKKALVQGFVYLAHALCGVVTGKQVREKNLP